MDLRQPMSHGYIDDLVKTSKHLQNKMRKELRRQNIEPTLPTRGEQQELPPIWDSSMHYPYVKNVVAGFLVDDKSARHKSGQSEAQADAKKSIKQTRCKHLMQRTQTQVSFDVQSKDTEVIPRTVSTTIGTQVSQQELQESGVEKTKHKESGTTTSPKKTVKGHRSTGTIGHSEGSRNQQELYKGTLKASSSGQKLPFQRFAGTSKRNINFSEEHPDLELDSSMNQATLFPIRLRKDNKTSSSVNVSPEKDAINLAAAKVKPPHTVAPLPEETWKEVLLRNPNRKKTHKKPVGAVRSHKEIPKPEVKPPKDIDIILKPPNGLFHLEKQNGRLSKQKKCDFQHFPVMYIRPECQVQRVASISIRSGNDGNTATESYPANVKYVKCTHEEEQKTDVASSAAKVGKSVADDNEKIRNQENKFFKALDSIKLPKNSSISRDSLSSPRKVSTKMRSRTSSTYSCSSSKVEQSTSPPSVDTSDNDVHHITEEVLPQTDQAHPTTTKDFIKNPPAQREVYVQTDYKEIAAPSPPPPPSPAPLTPPLPPAPQPPPRMSTSIPFETHPYAEAGRLPTTKQEDDNYSEDDFITKIFARIRNDIPNAVQAFKVRSSTAHEAMPLEPLTVHTHQEQKQSSHHQKTAIGNASNVDLRRNEIDPGLVRIEAKRHNSSHTILPMPPPVDTSVNLDSLPAGSEDQKLQQNPLFVQTINKIKSSAMPDGRIKEDRHKYPTDAEIKRAVEIFLDSLTLDDGPGGGRKSIIKGDVVRRKLTPSRSELISRRRATKYSSSASTNTSSSGASSSKNSGAKNSKSNTRCCDVSRSSTFTSSNTSDSGTDIDIYIDGSHQPSTQVTATSLSEGEVLSMGEI